MSKFSEMLTRLLKDTKANKLQLSKALQVDRAIIYRYQKGEALPSMELTARLAQELRLSPAVRAELLEAHNMAENGEEVFEQRRLVKKIIFDLPASIHKASDVSSHGFASTPQTLEGCPDVEIIQGFAGINARIKSMMDCAINSGVRQTLYLLLQPDCLFVMDALTAIPTSKRRNLTIQHGVRFCNVEETQDPSRIHNLSFVSTIVPLLFSSKQDASDFYSVFYYYESFVTKDARIMEVMPNLIISDDYALCMSHDYSKALFYAREDMVRFYQEEFVRLREHMFPLVRRLDSELELISFLYEIEQKFETSTFQFKSEPCLLSCISPSLVDAKMKPNLPDRELIGAIMKRRLEKFDEDIHNGIEFIEFFSERGLDHFLETGYFSDVPSAFVNPFNTEEKIEVLSRLRDRLLQYDNFCSYLVNENHLNIYDSGMFLWLHMEHSLQFGAYSRSGRDFGLIHLTEKSIFRAFEDYLTVFRKDRSIVSDKAATIALLDNRITMLQARSKQE